MKLRLHPLRENDTDMELILGVLVLPIAMLAALFVVHAPHRFPMFCLFHRWTGLSCPACGSFRCLQHLVAGRFFDAWLVNPLAAVLIIAAAVFVIYSWAAVIFRLRRPRLEEVSGRARWWLFLAGLVVVAANWTYLIAWRI